MRVVPSSVPKQPLTVPQQSLSVPQQSLTVPLFASSGPIIASVDDIVVTVKPNSRKGPLVEVAGDGTLTIFVREPATEGKANAAVAHILAKHFGVAKSRVILTGGATARTKRFRIDR
ncbi:MAG: hypothetical protein C0482_06895 [Gordonia sp.]|nr:hypothetical protein [Gordonia sp. (in: high G+C Gram-positive bacteria)]